MHFWLGIVLVLPFLACSLSPAISALQDRVKENEIRVRIDTKNAHLWGYFLCISLLIPLLWWIQIVASFEKVSDSSDMMLSVNDFFVQQLALLAEEARNLEVEAAKANESVPGSPHQVTHGSRASASPTHRDLYPSTASVGARSGGSSMYRSRKGLWIWWYLSPLTCFPNSRTPVL